MGFLGSEMTMMTLFNRFRHVFVPKMAQFSIFDNFHMDLKWAKSNNKIVWSAKNRAKMIFSIISKIPCVEFGRYSTRKNFQYWTILVIEVKEAILRLDIYWSGRNRAADNCLYYIKNSLCWIWKGSRLKKFPILIIFINRPEMGKIEL